MGKSISGVRIAAAVLLLAPLIAQAAGLGRLTVTSALGQPLSAEIEIVSLQAGEEDSLIARIASTEAFRQAGMELSSALIGAQLTILRRDGRPVIRIATDRPVNDPFLDLLVELQWASGKLVREYTLLLDPPELRRPKPVAEAPVAAPAPETKPAVAAPAPVKPAAVEARPIAAAPAKAARTHEVKRGETLAAVARTYKPEGVSLNQMLIALYRSNQDAFIESNINLMRAGRILSVPERDAAAAVDAAEATRLVQSQMSQFADYRRKLGAAVAAAPARPAPREREAAGRIVAKPGAPVPAEPKEQLRLSKVDPAKPSAAPTRAARDDDRIARDRALKDAQSRVTDLEKNVADLQKLLELKNRQLADLEKKGLVKPAPAPAAAPVAAPAKAPEVAKAPEARPAAETPKPAAEAPKPAPEAAKPAAEAPKEGPKPAAEAPKPPAEVAKAKPPAAAPPPKPAPETSVIDEFLDNPAALGGLGGVLALLIGYGAWAWRRKKAEQSQFQDSILGAAAGAGAAPVLGQAPAAAASAPAPRAAPAPASAPSVAPAEPEEVDPIAEADVYMAYGRSAQAEEILKEALGKDPNRIPVHAKLLEIYAERRDAKAFEQSALKLKNLTDGAGPQWEKAAALGRTVDPGNGLYGGDGSGEVPQFAAVEAQAETQAGAQAETPALDFDIGGGAAAEPSAPTATAAQDSTAALDFDLGGAPSDAEKSDFAPSGTLIIDSKDAQAETTGLDFDLGGGAPEEKPAAATATGLDFDLDTVSAKPETPKAEAPAPSADPDATIAVGGMNFDLNLDLGVPKKEAAAATGEAPLDLGSISLDLGASEPTVVAPAGDAKWQEVATKLDLAKAYEEMGDKDGARELLNEVMKEGDSAQQGQAQQMLANLG